VSHFLGGRVFGDVTVTSPLLMLQRGALDALRRSAFPDVEADTLQRFGMLQLGAYDCFGESVEDARIELFDGRQALSGVVPYLVPASRIPIRVPTDQPVYTGASGLVGYWGVPAGALQARAYRRGESEPFASAELGSLPGQMSQASLRPRYLKDVNVSAPPIEN
jgi:hypothetical protein